MSAAGGSSRFQAWATTWLTYATYYTGRKGFSVSKKAIFTELGVGEGALGAIDTAYLAAYAGGQFISGLLGDRIGARRLLSLGLMGSALCCAAFGASSAALAFGVAFFLNGLFQSTGWPGTTRAMAEWTTTENRGTVMAFWATCYQVGGIAASFFCAALLVRYGWRSTFFGPTLLLLLMAGLVLIFLRPGPRVRTAPEPGGATAPPEAADALRVEEGARVRAAQRSVMKSPLLLCYGTSYFFIKFIRYALLFWLPYYLATTLGYAGDLAAQVATAFEVGGIVGVIALGTLSDRLKKTSRAGISALSLLFLALSLLSYTVLSGQGLGANIFGLFLIGALLFGPDSLLSGAAAQDAGGPRAAAAATGMVNGLGSIGGMLEGLVVPWISQRWGWSALFPMLVLLALGSALALVPAFWLKDRA